MATLLALKVINSLFLHILNNIHTKNVVQTNVKDNYKLTNKRASS